MPLQIPFLLHVLIELPASLKFFFNPSSGLTTHTQTVKVTKSDAGTLSPEVVLVIRQYAILLFTSVLISASFVAREPDNLSKWVGGCLGLYHAGPIWRAIWRISRDNTLRITRHDMGGPVVHLGVHSTILFAFLYMLV